MNIEEARHVVADAIVEVAPEVDPAAVDGTADFREVLDLDSMDFINLVIAVAERTGVEIPERDYPALATLDGFAAYLCQPAA